MADDLFYGCMVSLENTKDFLFFFYTNLLCSFILTFVEEKEPLAMQVEMARVMVKTTMDTHLNLQ
jgi:hypothetical protein